MLSTRLRLDPSPVARFPSLVTHAWGWALAAFALGGLIALLPPAYSLALLAGGGLAALSLWEPAIGLGCALLLGPTRAYLAAAGYYGPLYDFGQLFFALAFAGWLRHNALRREIVVPRLGVLLPLAAWIAVGLVSLFGAAEWRDGLNESLKWLEVGVIIVIARAEARRGRLGWIVGAALASGVAQAGLGVWQYAWRGAGPESFQLPGGFYRAYGTFEQPNPFGGFLGLVWPVAAGLALGFFDQALRRRKAFSGQPPAPGSGGSGFGIWGFIRRLIPALGLAAIAGIMLVGLYVSFSRGGWLGAGAAALGLLAFFPRRLSLGLGLAVAALAGGWLMLTAGLAPASIAARLANVTDFVAVADVRGLNINDANFALVERLAHWQAAQAMAEAHPWLGVGLGNYAAAYPDYRLLNWPFHLGHAHNVYLHTLAETGVIGLAAYGSYWAAVIILTLRALGRTSGWRRGLALGLLGVWLHLLAHHLVDNLHVNNLDLLLAAYVGMLYALHTPWDPLRD